MAFIMGSIHRLGSQREDAVSIFAEHKTDPNARYSCTGKFQVSSHLSELNAAQHQASDKQLMNSVLDLMKIAFFCVGIVEI